MIAAPLWVLLAASLGVASAFFPPRSPFDLGLTPRASGLAFPPPPSLHPSSQEHVSPASHENQQTGQPETSVPIPDPSDHISGKNECPYGTVCVDEYQCPPYGRVKLHHGPPPYGPHHGPQHGPGYYPPSHGYGPYGRSSSARDSATSPPPAHAPGTSHGHHGSCSGYGRVCCKKEFLPHGYGRPCHGPYCSGGGYPTKHHGYPTVTPYGGYQSVGYGYPSTGYGYSGYTAGYGADPYNSYAGYGGYDSGYSGYGNAGYGSAGYGNAGYGNAGYNAYGYGGSYAPSYGGYGSNGYDQGYGHGGYGHDAYGSGYGGYDPYSSGYGYASPYGSPYGSPYNSPYGSPYGFGFPGVRPVPFGAEGANSSAPGAAPVGEAPPEQGNLPRADSPPPGEPASSRTSRMF